MTPLLIAVAVGGGVWGYVADRIAARWPEHEDGSTRNRDWRTVAVVIAGIASPVLLVLRYGTEPASNGAVALDAADPLRSTTTVAYLGILLVALVLLFATDLDQRLLPDVITLPIVGYALLGFVAGWGPFVRTPGDLLLAVVVAIAVPGIFFLISLPFGAGAIGMGDLKLLFGVGLLAGAERLVATVIIGALVAAVGIIVLLVARRITLKSYVPYGPFLIIGIIWALTVSQGL